MRQISGYTHNAVNSFSGSGGIKTDQVFPIIKKFPASSADDFLAPSPYIAPQLWRKSETVVAGIEMVDGLGVGGCD